jgi:DNA repair exonuclease SbcCD ATPase subunit
MKIVKLTAKNYMRLVAVEIKPDGNTILITGKNGMGKSSILKSIVSVLGGKKHFPDRPIREGEESAEVSITTENWVIKRTFTKAGGSSLTITGKSQDGMTSTANSPQKLLDKIKGSIAFDPMKFIAMGETEAGKREQRLMLMKLAKLDFADIDADIAGVKQVRADVRKDKERLEHEADRITVAEDTPDELVVLLELTKKHSEAVEHNAGYEELCTQGANNTSLYAGWTRNRNDTTAKIEALEAGLKEAKEQLEQEEAEMEEINKQGEAIRKKVEAFEKVDTDEIETQIENAEVTNVNVRKKKQKADLTKQSEAKADEWRKLGLDAKDLEQKKATRLSEAKFPLAGLSVTDDCVVMGDIPLSQVNSAEQLRVGLGIAMAENPELRVILMNGNDLDSDSLKVISEMTADKDYQVWIERIEGEGGIVIEDGMVKQ